MSVFLLYKKSCCSLSRDTLAVLPREKAIQKNDSYMIIFARILTINRKIENIRTAYARNPVKIRNSHHYCNADDGTVATG